jgi:excisionase family DNA binding protein
MDAGELGLMLRVSPRTIRRLAKRGRIPFYRVGSALRFDAVMVVETLGMEVARKG